MPCNGLALCCSLELKGVPAGICSFPGMTTLSERDPLAFSHKLASKKGKRREDGNNKTPPFFPRFLLVLLARKPRLGLYRWLARWLFFRVLSLCGLRRAPRGSLPPPLLLSHFLCTPQHTAHAHSHASVSRCSRGFRALQNFFPPVYHHCISTTYIIHTGIRLTLAFFANTTMDNHTSSQNTSFSAAETNNTATTTPAAATLRKRNTPHNGKFVDSSSGLVYDNEDMVSKDRLARTTVLMLLLVILISYFSYNIYLLLVNIGFDVYWHHIRGVRSPKNPNFIYQLWLNNVIDIAVLVFKMALAFYFFKFVNSKLLLSNIYNNKNVANTGSNDDDYL